MTPKWLTGPIALFNLAIGSAALFAPKYFASVMHQRMLTDLFLIQRMGALWLFFAAVAAAAFVGFRRFPALLIVLGALHLMDAPADIVYLLTAPTLSPFGRAALSCLPALNLVFAFLLIRMGSRLRADGIGLVELSAPILRHVS